jgi:ammonium transporter, Amt family
VSPTAAVIIGILAGIICFYAVALKNKLRWDDALDVWGVHGVGGFLGIVSCGIFASLAFNPAGTNGLLNGHPHFFLAQLGAVCIASVWAFVFTYGMLWMIDRITPVKVDEAGEAEGLDLALHGEVAYIEGL